MVEKPWGSYKNLYRDSENKFLIKQITIKPRQMISLQKHFYREELWYMIHGTGKSTLGHCCTYLYALYNDFLFIPCGELHRLENMSETEDLIFIEIQTGEKIDEDDIQRFEDRYGRIGKVII